MVKVVDARAARPLPLSVDEFHGRLGSFPSRYRGPQYVRGVTDLLRAGSLRGLAAHGEQVGAQVAQSASRLEGLCQRSGGEDQVWVV